MTRRGLVTESTRALVDAAFALPWVDHVEIRCDPANRASAAIPARLGFTHVETLMANATKPDGSPRDTMVWRLARDD
jgi:RimJ/RimL family protein N-acetyltransferase